jgi:hypothetical protein
MPSSLSWIDYDSESQQRAQRILTLFKERDTRDELGFGPIRDAISDSLFPGTSIIQTRLRYMLFIPWMYRGQEEKHVSSARVREYARWDQLKLAATLKENCPGELGIIGGDVGDKLKTLPSAIYWSGLGRWGIRVYPGTEGQYQRALDEIYRRRRRTKASAASAAEDGDDVGGLWELGAHTFHPGLPSVPTEFPENATFELSRNEARYLQERLRQSCPGSLLADLFANPVPVSIQAPWEHPNLADFHTDQRELVRHARLFSLVTNGAAILYNLMLAEIIDDDDRATEIRAASDEWLQRLNAEISDVVAWAGAFTEFWAAVQGRGHEISPRVMTFVEQWVQLLLEHRNAVFDADNARQLVRNREIEKKKANSRFTNARVRDQWGGSSGMRPMVYRWPLVQSYVADMAKALKQRP